jgi:hypothetical protein
VRQAHDHDIDTARGFGVRRIFEAQIGQPFEVRVRARNALPDVIVGAHAHDFDAGMIE